MSARLPWVLPALVVIASALAGCTMEVDGSMEDWAEDGVDDAAAPAAWLWPEGDVYLLVDLDFWEFDVSWALDNAITEVEANTGIRVHVIDDPEDAPRNLYTRFSGRFGWIGGGSAPVGVSSGGEAEAGGSSVRHELGHIIGLHHTHARRDRDDHVVFHQGYVLAGKERNFAKDDRFRLVGPYDFDSIMHYGSDAGSTRLLCSTLSRRPPGAALDVSACVNPYGERGLDDNSSYSEWNYSVMAALYCEPRLCGDNCASAARCSAPAVRRNLQRLRDWDASAAGRAQATRYPDP